MFACGPPAIASTGERLKGIGGRGMGKVTDGRRLPDGVSANILRALPIESRRSSESGRELDSTGLRLTMVPSKQGKKARHCHEAQFNPMEG